MQNFTWFTFEIIDDAITLLEEQYITADQFREGRAKIDYAIKVLNGYIQYLQRQKDQPKHQ